MDGNYCGMGIGGDSLIVIGQGVVDYVQRVNNRKDGYGFSVGIGVEKNGVLVGGVALHEFNGRNIFIHVASDHPGSWVNREFLHCVFSYCFDQAKVERITGIVAEGNAKAFKFDTAVGFVEETRMKDAHPTGDLIVLKMTRDTCKWINHERFTKPAASP